MTFILAPNSLLSMAGMVSILRAHARAADGEFPLERILPGPDPRGMPGDANRRIGIETADPVDAQRIEFRPLDSEKRDEWHARMHQSEHGAVFGCHRVEIVHGANAAGPRHVLDDDAGIAWNVLAEERRERAGVAGVTTAGISAEDPRDLAAFVEVVAGAGRGWRENRKRHGTQ